MASVVKFNVFFKNTSKLPGRLRGGWGGPFPWPRPATAHKKTSNILETSNVAKTKKNPGRADDAGLGAGGLGEGKQPVRRAIQSRITGPRGGPIERK